MSNPEFRTDAWPILHVRIFGSDDDASIERLLSGLSRHIARGACGVVIDTTDIVYPGFGDAQRWMQQEGLWLRENRSLLRTHTKAVAFVISNPAIRFVLSGILLIAPLPCPHQVTSSMQEARRFCSEHLRHDSKSEWHDRGG